MIKRHFDEQTDARIYENISAVLKSGLYSSRYGEMTRRFEVEFAKRVGAKYAIAVNSGTSALHVALMACGIGPGDEVIVPPIGPIMTAAAVLKVGAVPVFVDIDRETYRMNVGLLIKHRYNIHFKAVIPVHLFGRWGPMNLESIMNRWTIIEDCAQSLSPLRGDIACYSFEQSKHICCGDGGVVVTDDEDLADKMRDLSDVARSTEVNGYNYRMTELTAAVGLAQIDTPGGRLYRTEYHPDDADEYEKHLEDEGVEFARAPWGKLVYQHKLFGEQKGLCPIAEKIHPNLFIFPVRNHA